MPCWPMPKSTRWICACPLSCTRTLRWLRCAPANTSWWKSPWRWTLRRARRMIAEAERAGRILMIAQVLRFFPEYMALRNALPRLGKVRSAFFRRRCAAPAWGGWLKDPISQRRRRVRPADPRCRYVPAFVRRARRRFRRSAIWTRRPAWTWCTASCIYPFGTVGYRRLAARGRVSRSAWNTAVTTDGGTVEYSSAGRRAHAVYASGRGPAAGRQRRLRRGDRVFCGVLPLGAAARAVPAARIGAARGIDAHAVGVARRGTGGR